MPYHHGNLRDALVDAAYALAAAGGPDAVVLRAASRAAGVSHNAAYRHFADRDDLLHAVCQRAMVDLGRRMASRQAALVPSGEPVADAWDRLEATGRAYIDFALSQPNLFRTAFAVPKGAAPLDLEDGPDPFALLNEALDGLVAVGARTPEQRAGAEFAAWAAVHGAAELLLDGPLRLLDAHERQAVIDRVILATRAGL